MLNEEFCKLNEESWDKFTHSETTPEQFATDFNGSLTSFLHSKPEFQIKVNKFYKHKPNCQIALEEAKELKKT